jgi:hypothetical protein
MWLFAQGGFLSIVEDKNNKDSLIVRGRVDGDIEHYFPDALVVHTPEHDYAYRAFLPKETAVRVIANAVREIDYPKFKPSILDKARRAEYYLDVWGVMYRMQKELNEDADSSVT